MKAQAAPGQDFRWLLERIGYTPRLDFRAIEAVRPNGTIAGMVGFDGWTDNSVQAHMAVETPMAWRALLRPVFEYAFLQCGRTVVLGIIRATNKASVRMCKSLGFRETFRVRDGWAKGESLILFELRREDCRWLTPEERAA